MRLQSILKVVFFAITIALLGCGDNNDDVKKGIGNYLDAPVKGINYVCGSVTGITGKNGIFKYEQNKKCIFKLGDIKIKEFKALNKDKMIIMEDDIYVAALLQSLDSDGNRSNGIEITSKVANNIKSIMEELNIKTISQIDDDIRENLIIKVKNRTFSSRLIVVSLDNAKEHLNNFDTDGDGVPDIQEISNGTDPFVVDNDNTNSCQNINPITSACEDNNASSSDSSNNNSNEDNNTQESHNSNSCQNINPITGTCED